MKALHLGYTNDYEIGEYINLYALSSEFKTLPYKGGLLDQPNKMVEMFMMIKTELAKEEQRSLNGRNKG